MLVIAGLRYDARIKIRPDSTNLINADTNRGTQWTYNSFRPTARNVQPLERENDNKDRKFGIGM
jgi:hypothetical protein